MQKQALIVKDFIHKLGNVSTQSHTVGRKCPVRWRNINLIKIYAKTTQQKRPSLLHSRCSGQEIEAAPTQNIMFVPLFHRCL